MARKRGRKFARSSGTFSSLYAALEATADSRGSGTLDKHRTTINSLPDDVLLEIFDFCQIDSNTHLAFICPGSDWLRLVHICQRWRRIVLVSPRRLDLTLFCTYGTPVRKNLGFFATLPNHRGLPHILRPQKL
jgi:hypothetical protein